MHLDIAEALWAEALNTKTKNLDKKHAKIIESAKENSFEHILSDYRNSRLQNDMGAPFQFNFYSLKSYGFLKYIKYLLATLRDDFLDGKGKNDSFFDDIEIIKLMKGYDILKKCPLHESPGKNLAYFISNNISANTRWLRYIYFASVLRNNCKLSNNSSLFLDIGSYYGGFQYVIKKIYPSSLHLMVDFPHQLSRSTIFLSQAFQNAKIYAIYNKKTFEEYFLKKFSEDFDFLLISTEFFHKFSSRYKGKKIDISTNFYSFGEMLKKDFNSYMNSKLLNDSRILFFSNRYDSSPFYEPTYAVSYSIMDYLKKGFKIKLNRSSGIHNYMTVRRKIFGSKRSRPVSAGYFDLIQEKI